MVLDKHVPMKCKKTRGNHAPFMSRELSKANMNTIGTQSGHLAKTS